MTKRDRLMILTVMGVVLVLGFWMLVLNPQRKSAKEAQIQLDTAKQSLSAAQAKLTAGQAAQQAFRRDRTTIVKLGRTVPETDDIPTLLTQLQTLAKRYDVTFATYKIDSANSGAAASTSTSASGNATTVPQGANGKEDVADSETNAIAPLYPPGSVEIAGGLGRTPVTITLIGGYFELERYLRAVQRFAVLSAKEKETKGRLMIVDGFTYKPSEHITYPKVSGSKITTDHTKLLLEAELGASVYFAPPLDVPSAAAASAAVAGSGATPAAATSTTTTSTGAAAVGGIR